MSNTLENINIALPESRQLDVLANLCVNRGARVWRCPLVSIHDSPNAQAIELWMKNFIEQTPDILLVLTGEGIKRLTAFAERFNCLEQWKGALSHTHILARGPKPNRALKVLKLEADQLAETPTTDGMMASLEKMDLNGKTLAVQLYGEDPNQKLQDYLKLRSANYNTVAPYVYASNVDTERVLNLINALAENAIDIICFTSKAQYQRLEKVAEKHQMTDRLTLGLQHTQIAVVGPVVADQLKEAGYKIATMPEGKFFMKPMIRAIEQLIVD